jgi:3-oxoacyl-[acyl-carrier protein] reductase
MKLKGKTALVTGGGTGLGRAISLRLAREGVDLAINYSKSKEDAEKTASEARSLGVRAVTVRADVSSAAEIERAVAETEQALGRIDLLINNAGTTKFVSFGDLDGLDEDDWLDLYKTNTMSVFFASRAAARVMRKNGGGRIVNTVSNAGLRAAGSSIAYSVSKAAGIHLTKCLAVALGPEIAVNAVAPGMLLTRWHENTSAEQIESARKSAVLKKEVDVEQCAAMYLALLENDNITGQTVTVDSGVAV